MGILTASEIKKQIMMGGIHISLMLKRTYRLIVTMLRLIISF